MGKQYRFSICSLNLFSKNLFHCALLKFLARSFKLNFDDNNVTEAFVV